MSASSLHRESTESLIIAIVIMLHNASCTCIPAQEAMYSFFTIIIMAFNFIL